MGYFQYPLVVFHLSQSSVISIALRPAYRALTLISKLPFPNSCIRSLSSFSSWRYRFRQFCVIRCTCGFLLASGCKSCVPRVSCSDRRPCSDKAYFSKKTPTHRWRDVAARLTLSPHSWMIKYILGAYEIALRLCVHRRRPKAMLASG
jgi:hypothetical protein